MTQIRNCADDGESDLRAHGFPLTAPGIEWILSEIDEAVVGLDEMAVLRYVNSAACRLIGLDRDQLIGRNIFEMLHPDEHDNIVLRLDRSSGKDSSGFGPTVRVRHGSGKWIDIALDVVIGPGAEPFSSIAICRPLGSGNGKFDSTPSGQETRLTRMASAFVHLPAERIDDGIRTAIAEMGSLDGVDRVTVVVIDVDEDEGREMLRITHEWVAPGVKPLRGRHKAVRKAMTTGVHPPLNSPLMKALHRMEVVHVADVDALDHSWDLEREVLKERNTGSFMLVPLIDEGILSGFISFESTNRHTDWDSHHLAVLHSGAGIISQALARQAAEEDLAHRARHDTLTGLGNRWDFLDHLATAVGGLDADADRSGRDCIAVLLFDLDRFKVVNDALGHTAGDQLLRAVAQRLDAARRPSDTIARLGGDEIVVLCRNIHEPDEAIEVARQMQKVLVHPMEVGGQETFVTTSVGVAFASTPDVDAEDLLRNADAAMYMAKARGRNRIELYGDELRELTQERLSSETALKRAVLNSELEVHFQPEYSLPDGRILGAEALVRWRHPSRGLLAAVDFIDIAEETGAILEIGSWVLEEAARHLGNWQRIYPNLEFVMRVNLSTRQMVQADLVEQISSVLEASGVRPDSICLEITETTLMVDTEISLDVLERLHKLGVELAIDDFGTGYSSLSYLKQLPVDLLKIDKSFIDGLGVDPNDTSIVSAVVSLASALNLDVTAEGVETETQYKELVRLGVGRAQGFMLGRPMPASDLEVLLA